MHSLKQLKATENTLKALTMSIKREQSCLRLKRKCKKLKEDNVQANEKQQAEEQVRIMDKA